MKKLVIFNDLQQLTRLLLYMTYKACELLLPEVAKTFEENGMLVESIFFATFNAS